MDYKAIRDFYNALQDDESRHIFMCRWQYLLSGNESYLREMVKTTDEKYHRRVLFDSRDVRILYTKVDKNDIPVILYGTGDMSGSVLDEMRENGVNPAAFCDSSPDKAGSTHLGLPVISKELLFDGAYKDCRVVVSTLRFQLEICEDLISSGFPAGHIYTISDIQYDCGLQYFGPEFIKPAPQEVFVDGGAFDGGTIRDFIHFCNNNYKRVYAFEPHPESFAKLKENIQAWGYERVSLIDKAVWSCRADMDFSVLHEPIKEQGSKLVNGRSPHKNSSITKVQTETIDNAVGKDNVTFIKLDVEGAELEALKGAYETINRNSPKLAVSIYHKAEDIAEIPVYLIQNWPDYKFYIRHHRDQFHPYPYLFNETILYAV